MITFKDLKNKVYRDKMCTRFECEIVLKDKIAIANFDKCSGESPSWNMQIVLGRTRDKDSDVYNFSYVMPREGLPLELIAATGLRFFQLYLKDEIQLKTEIEFEIGELVRGM